MALCVGYLERSFQKVHIFFMKICYIPTFNLPWCATSWRRALEFGKVVSKYHQLIFLCPESAVPRLQSQTQNVNVEIIPVKFNGQGYLARGLARVQALKKYDIVHTFKPLPDIFPVGFAAKFKGARWIADLDDLEGGQGYNRNSALWKRKLMDFFEWLVPTFASHITVASKGLEEFYKKFEPFYIPNGVDPEVFRPSEKNESKLKVLFMGMFHADIIDADVIVRAIARVSEKHNVKLLIVGGGDDLARAKKLAEELKIDSEFTGHIDDVPSVIGSANIGVISFRDNLLNNCKCPLRLYEYMACGLPIVSTKVGEPAYVLKDGAGLLVEPNVESVSDGIMNLIENKELAKTMGGRGRKLIEEEYNWQNLGEKLVKFYEKVTNKSK